MIVTSPHKVRNTVSSTHDAWTFIFAYNLTIARLRCCVQYITREQVYGPEQNDLVLQLCKRKMDRVILGGMSANICVEAHMRELLEQGFDVTVVSDATAAAKLPDLGDGYQAALVNFKFMANALVNTTAAITAMGRDASSMNIGDTSSNVTETNGDHTSKNGDANNGDTSEAMALAGVTAASFFVTTASSRQPLALSCRGRGRYTCSIQEGETFHVTLFAHRWRKWFWRDLLLLHISPWLAS